MEHESVLKQVKVFPGVYAWTKDGVFVKRCSRCNEWIPDEKVLVNDDLHHVCFDCATDEEMELGIRY